MSGRRFGDWFDCRRVFPADCLFQLAGTCQIRRLGLTARLESRCAQVSDLPRLKALPGLICCLALHACSPGQDRELNVAFVTEFPIYWRKARAGHCG